MYMCVCAGGGGRGTETRGEGPWGKSEPSIARLKTRKKQNANTNGVLGVCARAWVCGGLWMCGWVFVCVCVCVYFTNTEAGGNYPTLRSELLFRWGQPHPSTSHALKVLTALALRSREGGRRGGGPADVVQKNNRCSQQKARQRGALCD